MYIRDPRGAIRSYAYDAMGDDLPVCSQSTPVGAKCVQPDESPPATSTSDWLKSMFGGGSPQPPPTVAATPAVTPPPADASPGFFQSVAGAISKVLAPQQQAPAVVASSGPDTGTILVVGAVGVAAIYLLTRKKKA
jgi:hypothetical protein